MSLAEGDYHRVLERDVRSPGIRGKIDSKLQNFGFSDPKFEHREVKEIAQMLTEDNHTVRAGVAENTLDAVLELDEAWEDYDLDLYHGMTSIDLEGVISNGLMPGAQVESTGGEFNDRPEVSLSPYSPVAIEYARNGTPTLEKSQETIDKVCEYLEVDPMDLSTESGRREFERSVNQGDIRWRGGYLQSLASRMRVLDMDWDAVVVGANIQDVNLTDDQQDRLSMLPDDHGFEEVLGLDRYPGTDVEYVENSSGSLAEVRIAGVSRSNLQHIFVPQSEINGYREQYSEDVDFLSLQGLQLRTYYENSKIYEDQKVNYSLPWALDEVDEDSVLGCGAFFVSGEVEQNSNGIWKEPI